MCENISTVDKKKLKKRYFGKYFSFILLSSKAVCPLKALPLIDAELK